MTDLASVIKDYEALAQTAHELNTMLQDAAFDLEHHGRIPNSTLLEYITTLQDNMDHLSNRIQEAAQTIHADIPHSTDTTIHTLKAQIAALITWQEEQATRARVEYASAVLEKLLRLRHRDRESFPELEVCQDHARTLMGEIVAVTLPNMHPEVEALVMASHPLAQLIAFIDNQATQEEAASSLVEALDGVFGKAGMRVGLAAVQNFLVYMAQRPFDADLHEPQSDSLEPLQTSTDLSAPTTALVDMPAIDDIQSHDHTGEPDRADAHMQVIPEQSPHPAVDDNLTPPALTSHDPQDTDMDVDQPHEDSGGSAQARTAPLVPASVADGNIPLLGENPNEQSTRARADEAALKDSVADQPAAESQVSEDALPLSNGLEGAGTRDSLALPASDGHTEANVLLPDAQGPIADLAQFLLDHGIENMAVFSTLLWRLLADGSYDTAFQLASTNTAITMQAVPSAALIRGLALALALQSDSGDIAEYLKQDYQTVLQSSQESDNPSVQEAIGLLYTAAAMQPALLAPSTEALALLSLWPSFDSLPVLSRYLGNIRDFAAIRRPLDIAVLEWLKNQLAWQHDLEQLQREAQLWFKQANQRNIKYEPARRVWLEWLRPGGGYLALMLEAIMENNTGSLNLVANQAAVLANHAAIKQHIADTDRKILNRSVGKDITLIALDQMIQHVQPVIQFARRWLRLQEGRSDPLNNYVHQQTQRLYDTLTLLYPDVKAELHAVKTAPATSLQMHSAIGCVQRALNQLHHFLVRQSTTALYEPPIHHVYAAVLLQIPKITLADDWTHDSDGPTLRNAILNMLAKHQYGWMEAFEQQAEKRDYRATDRIITYLDLHDQGILDIEQLRSRQRKMRDEWVAALRRDLEGTRRSIEAAVAHGLLREQERLKYISRVEHIETNLPIISSFKPYHKDLEAIRKDIDQRNESAVEEVRRRLAQGTTPLDEAQRQHIEHLLEQRDMLTAHEYLDMIQRGETLPESLVGNESFERFLSIFEELERFLSDPPPTYSVVRYLTSPPKGGERPKHWPLDMKRIQGKQAEIVAQIYQHWFELKRDRLRLRMPAIQTLFTGLGFSVLSTTLTKTHQRGIEVELKTQPLHDKNLCPISHYGSDAGGTYSLLLVWDRPAEEDLLNDLRQMVHKKTVIVCYFGRLSARNRREIARLCRMRGQTCIILDETLMLYLCAQPAPRLRHLFLCTLPYTYLEPYTTTASIVPPEMFYGRRHERDSILSEYGLCFIYGGRQLGKTALLRDVERSHHSPDTGVVILWIDLKAYGIGYERPIEDIWSVIAKRLKDQAITIIPPAVPLHTAPDRLLDHIEQWLKGHSQRRIILLLDEADRFLDHDGNKGEFQNITKFKRLMEATQRRFKTVFAGLHNVQRTTRISNNALAHYGDAVCIGPLLDNEAWREARALIEQPLQSLGYQFDSPDLVTRILSQTNYYPSLIQLYCAELVRHLVRQRKQTARDTFPYTITSQHLEDVYQSKDLRESIRHRFNLSLQLDQRYEVIAYAVAYEYLLSHNQDIVGGFEDRWIADRAFEWWPQGFAPAASLDSFRALLDEMVGLGILRATQEQYYTLRSPNVVLLMGNHDYIEAELFRDREPPIEYEPAILRAAWRVGDIPNNADRSPLTAYQESFLKRSENGITIVCGTDLAGLRDLPRFLQQACGQGFFIELDHTATEATFYEELDRLTSRLPDGTTMILVAPEIWSDTWVREALKRLRRLHSKTAWARIVFVADPHTTWRMIKSDMATLFQDSGGTLPVVSLAPWNEIALRHWIEDTDIVPSTRQNRETIAQLTGNWPYCLYEFYKRTDVSRHDWQGFVEDLHRTWQSPDVATTFVPLSGLDCSEPRRLLDLMAQYGDSITIDELLELDDTSFVASTIEQCLRWAEWLQLVERVGKDRWRLNSFIQQLCLTTETRAR